MKIKTFFIALFILTAVYCRAQEQKMSVSDVFAFRQSVNGVAKKIKSLSTDFVQFKHMDFLAKDIETSGKMYFKEPNLLLWQYKKPYNYSIVFKNGKILINDEGKKSAVDIGNSKIFGKLNKLIVGSVSGDMFDDKEFTIEYFKNKEFNIAKLTPKEAALKKYIKQVYLYFPPNESVVSKVKLIEPSDDYTLIIFKNKVINAPIDDSSFSH